MKKDFKPYPKYRDSGTPSVGNIPHHWEIKPMRSLFSFSKGLSITKEDLRDEGVPCVNYGEIHSKYGFRVNPSLHPLKCVTPDYLATHPQAALREGDLVFADTSEDIEGSGNFTRLEGDSPTFAGYHTIIARPDPKIGGRFLAYEATSAAFRTQIRQQVKGIKVFSISQGMLKSLRCWLPPEAEREAIAAFLEAETANIDEAIKELEGSVALLREEQQALAQSVITGASSTKPRKESGADWLGKIPVHWRLERSKVVLAERNQRSESGTEELLTVSHISGVTKRSEKDVNMFEAESTAGYKVCFPGDLVINTLWAWMGAMGVSQEHGIVSPAYHVYEIRSMMLPEFVDALVRLPNFKLEAARFSKGVWSSRMRLYPEGLFEIKFPIPPPDEQLDIVAAVKTACSKSKLIASEKQALIAFLKEYRTSLIYEAVTGKIDLRAA
jgi:type I restriction enzyme, S subunit